LGAVGGVQNGVKGKGEPVPKKEKSTEEGKNRRKKTTQIVKPTEWTVRRGRSKGGQCHPGQKKKSGKKRHRFQLFLAIWGGQTSVKKNARPSTKKEAAHHRVACGGKVDTSKRGEPFTVRMITGNGEKRPIGGRPSSSAGNGIDRPYVEPID